MLYKIDLETLAALVTSAQLELHLSQRELGELLGSSLRTAQRWSAGSAHPSPDQIRRLAIAVHPRSRDLGIQLAAAVGETLESLGLVRPAPVHDTIPASPPTLPPELVPYLVESVVSAAAEVLAASPAVARGALAAALERAKATHLSVDEMLAVLRPPQGAAKANAAGRRSAPGL